MSEFFETFYMIFKYIMVILSLVWILIKKMIGFLFGFFNFGGNMGFLDFFQNSLNIIFIILLFLFIFLYFFGQNFGKIKIASNLYQKIKINSFSSLFFKFFIFISLFSLLNIYFNYLKNVSFDSFSKVVTNGVVIDLEKEKFGGGGFQEKLSKIVKFGKIYPGVIEFPEEKPENNLFIYKIPDIKKTEVFISINESVKSNKIEYGKIEISGMINDDAKMKTKILYQSEIQNYEKKELGFCGTGTININSSKIGTDLKNKISKHLVDFDLEFLNKFKKDKEIQLLLSNIDDNYGKIRKKYFFINNVNFLYNEEQEYSDYFYEIYLKSIFCFNGEFQEEDGEKKYNKIKKNIYQLKKNLIGFNLFLEDSKKEIKEDGVKLMFLASIINGFSESEVLEEKINFGLSGGGELDINEKIKYFLTIPFLIDIKGGNKIINGEICSQFVFQENFENNLIINGKQKYVNFLNSNCFGDFGLVYLYSQNRTKTFGGNLFKFIIKILEKNENGTSGFIDGLINYGNYSVELSSLFTDGESIRFEKKNGTNFDELKKYKYFLKEKISFQNNFFHKILNSLIIGFLE